MEIGKTSAKGHNELLFPLKTLHVGSNRIVGNIVVDIDHLPLYKYSMFTLRSTERKIGYPNSTKWVLVKETVDQRGYAGFCIYTGSMKERLTIRYRWKAF
jgi:hypothetical protein